MGFTKYIPDFLLPTEEPQPPTRIYDAPLRRAFFHKAKEGNEQTITASRNGSVVSERRESEASRRQSEPRDAWHPGMALPYSMNGAAEQNAKIHWPRHHQGKHHNHGDMKMAD